MPDAPGDSLPVVNMLWVEGRLGPIERACMRSVMAQGHRVVLWSYFPLDGFPEGVECRDGDEVVPRERLFRHEPSGSWALFANLFRYRVLQLGLGLWVDCDSYHVKPIAWGDGIVVGFDSNHVASIGVLALPADSPILSELVDYFDGLRIPPWLGPGWRARFWLQRLITGRIRVERMPWGYLGPYAITPLMEQYGLLSAVRPQHVFYPWSWQEADLIFGPEELAWSRVHPETLTMHLYNQMIGDRKEAAPPPGSFLARLHKEGR